MKPVSFMMSRMSVKGTRGNEFQRLAPRAQRTFLFTGRREAARDRALAITASAVRRFIVTDVTLFRNATPCRIVYPGRSGVLLRLPVLLAADLNGIGHLRA